jgi:hypothetical protein
MACGCKNEDHSITIEAKGRKSTIKPTMQNIRIYMTELYKRSQGDGSVVLAMVNMKRNSGLVLSPNQAIINKLGIYNYGFAANGDTLYVFAEDIDNDYLQPIAPLPLPATTTTTISSGDTWVATTVTGGTVSTGTVVTAYPGLSDKQQLAAVALATTTKTIEEIANEFGYAISTIEILNKKYKIRV